MNHSKKKKLNLLKYELSPYLNIQGLNLINLIKIFLVNQFIKFLVYYNILCLYIMTFIINKNYININI